MSEEPSRKQELRSPPAAPGGKRQLHLTGFMGSGKSTVGQQLARRLLWNFLDLDAVVARHAEKSVARIFAEGGEESFRAMESHVLRQLVKKPHTVVALGGGTLLDPRNREICVQAATVVWLRCPLELLQLRCAEQAGERPLWGAADELAQRYEARLPGYRSADLTIDAAGSPAEVAEAVLAALGLASSSHG
ncbi:MAG: shikimate kinase [Acidobacteriota bacterium]